MEASLGVVEAVKVGPFVVPLVRAFVALALAGFLLTAEVLARRGRKDLASWAWNAVLAGLLGARVGYVVSHFAAYARDPLSVLYFWQGGFSPIYGLLAGAAYTLWYYRRRLSALSGVVPPVLVGGLVAAALFGLSARQASLSGRLPGWALPTPDGRVLALSELKGRPVVLNVWASWCPPCRRELPLLLEYARKHPGVAFVFVDSGEPLETVRAFLKRNGLRLPHLAIDREGRLVRRLRVVALPTTVFFDAQGRAVARHLGELSRAGLEDALKRILPPAR